MTIEDYLNNRVMFSITPSYKFMNILAPKTDNTLAFISQLLGFHAWKSSLPVLVSHPKATAEAPLQKHSFGKEYSVNPGSRF